MRFMFACGGTAGHIYPAIAVADRLKEIFPEADFLFVGAEGNMEMELVPREGYSIKTLRVSGLRRSLKPSNVIYNVRSFGRTELAVAKAGKLIKDFSPDAVLGTGGYVCYPVVRAAYSLGVPALIHESNACPGLTTRMLEKYAGRIMVGFEESRSYYKHPEKIEVTGTPVRRGFVSFSREEAKRRLGYTDGQPLVLSFWGSLGASRMNEYTAEIIAMNERDGLFRHVHATGGGEAELERIKELVKKAGAQELRQTELRAFIYDMPLLMAAADVVMCRSGASTIAELTATGTPTVQVPSKNVTDNHQEKNARLLEKQGGAIVITEGECSAERMYSAICQCVCDSRQQRQMAGAMLQMGRPEAVENIVEATLELVKK